MKRFWTRNTAYVSEIPAPQQEDAHQERVLQALWPDFITRRRFLIGVGSGLPLVGSLARAATNFSTLRDQHGVSVTVSGLPLWRVDTRWFDGKPRIRVRESANVLQVDLRQARFPGTDIAADFTLKAIRQGAEWNAQIIFEALGFASNFNFGLWLLGNQPALSKLHLLSAHLTGARTVTLTNISGEGLFRPDWSFLLEHKASGTLSLAGKLIGLEGLRLELDVAAELASTGFGTTRVWALLTTGAELEFNAGTSVLELGVGPVLAFINARRDKASVLVQPAALDDAIQGANMCWRGESSVRLPIDNACGRFEFSRNNMTASALARWKEAYWHVENNLAVRFSTANIPPTIALVSSKPGAAEKPPLSPIADNFVVDIPGVDAALFQLRAIPGYPVDPSASANPLDFVRNGVPLRHYDLKLRRASDGMFCTVRFSGLKLLRNERAWRLVQVDVDEEALVEFDLGPQHLMEEAVLLEDWPCPDENSYKWPGPDEAFGLSASRPVIKAFSGISSTRFEAARPSHLTFQLRRKSKSKGKLAELPLTVDALFSWTDDGIRHKPLEGQVWLEPLLSPRALPAGTPSLLDQVTRLAKVDDLVIQRPQSLAENAPDNVFFGTAIEVPARLVINPVPPNAAATGHAVSPWQSPPPGPVANGALRDLRAELWHARLSDTKIRAIYTPDANGTGPIDRSNIRVDVFAPPIPFPSPRDPFRSSLDSRDRHELVALTALYGFATLCSETPEHRCAPAKLPNGTETLEGSYLPVPIKADLLLLSSQGATFRYRGRWDPPAAPGGTNGALSVKGYIHWSQLGRDIFVKVEYKGFLFPLGHPAILIKQTERQFCLKNGKQFVAGLLQRFFIHVPQFTRQFPAVEQGMDGRLWGHATTTMDEFTTHSLANPNDSPFLAPPPSDVSGQSAFWPRLPGRGGVGPTDVLFEFYEHGTEARYQAPLVWIDNGVAHNAISLKKLIDAWRAEVGARLNLSEADWPPAPNRYFAAVRSARLPYVLGMRGKNTEIETTSILLGVQVHEDDIGYNDTPATCYAKLITTPRMEAQNQPPFYPLRRRARIVSSQIATLTGKRSEAHLMEFDQVYARIGMAPANASTVFGVFAGRGPLMNFSDDTSKSGGFASPSARIVNMTEKRGPVGGPETAIVPLGIPPQACDQNFVALARENLPSTSDDFKPTDYFAAVLGDAKLLGVVRLIDILETLTAATGTSFPTIKHQSLFELPLSVLREIIPLFENKLAGFDIWFTDPENQRPPIPIAVAARLQPSWNRLRAGVKAATKVINQAQPSDLAVIASASEISSAAQELVSETRALAADPALLLPEAARQLLEEAQQLINMLRTLLPPQGLVQIFKPLLDAFIEEKVVQLIDELTATIVDSPAYKNAYLALKQLKQLILEFRQAASDAVVLMESIRHNLLQRLQIAAAEAVLQLTIAGQKLLIGPTTLLGILAPLIADQIVSEVDRYNTLIIKATTPITQPLLNLHTMLNMYSTLVTPKDGAEQTQLQEIFSRLHQAVSSISDGLNAHVDRMQRIAEDVRHLQDWFPPVQPLAAASATATPLTNLVPLLGDVMEQIFDGINFGLLTVTRFADMVVDLNKLVPNISTDALKPALKAIADASVSIGELIPAKQLSVMSAQLTELSKQPSVKALQELWPLFSPTAEAVLKLRAMLVDKGGLLTSDAEQIWTAAGATIYKDIQSTYAREFKLLPSLDRLRNIVVKAVRMFSPDQFNSRTRVEVQHRIDKLKAVLEDIANKKTAEVAAAATNIFCTGTGKGLLGLLTKLSSSTSPYLSDKAKTALKFSIEAVQSCSSANPKAIGEIFDSLVMLMALLGRSLANGDVSQLISVEKLLDEIIAQFGIPTRVRIDYDWDTTVESFPKGDDAIFEPLKERRLVIKAVMEASVREGKPSASIRATLSPYAVHLFGKVSTSNFLSIYFDGLILNAAPDTDTKCETNVTLVAPGEALGFVKNLSTLFGAESGFYMLPTFSGIEVGYKFASDYELLAGLVLQNISFSISAALPFDNSPMRIKLQLSDKEKPFLCSAGVYGGGGFLAISTRADTLELLEASFEYGAVVAFSYGPAKGSGRVTAGIYIRMGGRDPVIEGFFCAQGEVNIAGLVAMSASLRVVLAYSINTGQTAGWAVYTFKFSIGFFDFKYSARVDYAKDGDQGSQKAESSTASDGMTMLTSDRRPLKERKKKQYNKGKAVDARLQTGLLTPALWRRYWRAFQPINPDVPRRLSSVSKAPDRPYLRGSDPKVDTAVKGMLASLDIPQALKALQEIEWYCVPWGVQSDNKSKDPGVLHDAGPFLSISIRAMPKFCQNQCPTVSAARGDWPTFVAAISNVSLQINGHLINVDLGSLYVAHLKELGLTLADMSRLWKEVFPDSLPSPTKEAALVQTDPRTRRLMVHDSADLANVTAVRVGLLFADALGNFKPGRMASLASQGFIPQSDVSNEAGTLLNAMASIYAPITSRQRIPVTAFKEMAASGSKESVVRQWYQTILRAQGNKAETYKAGIDKSMDTLSTPYSNEALLYLEQQMATAQVEGMEAQPPAITDRFARRLLEQKVAYTSDLPGKSYLEPETFHHRLAGLTTHPWMLKALGLVIDLKVSLDGTGKPAAFNVMLESWTLGSTAFIQPDIRMRTRMTEDGFPEIAPGDLKNAGSSLGCLDISVATKNSYTLSQLDIDRTPQRLFQLALAYRAEIMSGRRASEVSSGMQGQETVGLALISKDPQILPPPLAMPASGEINDVYLHHLVIGYRPDVQRLVPAVDPAGARTAPWSSLMARKVRRVRIRGRDITRLLAGVEIDEGILMERTRTVEARPGNKNSASADLIEGELFRWGNWVLGAPHPGSEGAKVETAPKDDQLVPSDYFTSSLEIEYAAAEGATPQRYGSGYRVGMRLVMIDGNSVPIERAARDRYSDAVGSVSLGDETRAFDYGFAAFLRYEPIAPPMALLVVKPQRERFPSESARKLVVASGALGYNREITQRVLVAPRCASIDLAIRHSMFDASGPHDTPPASAFPGVRLTPSGDFPSYNHGSGEQAARDLYFRPQIGAPAPEIPYYPDPWAERMIIGFYRAADDCLLAFDFFNYFDSAHRWPNCRALHLDLIAVDRVNNVKLGFDWVLVDQRLTLRIAPGVRLTLRTWHEMDVGKLNQSAVIDQLVTACGDTQCGPQLLANLNLTQSATVTEVREAIISNLSQWHAKRNFEAQTARPVGRKSTIANLTSFWMLNPPLQLELLHAVARPLRPPELSDASKEVGPAPRILQLPAQASGIELPFRIERKVAETSASFAGHLRLHRQSTRSIKGQATWKDNAMRAVYSDKTGQYTIKAERHQGLLFNLSELAEIAVDDMGRPPLGPMAPELFDQDLQLLEASLSVSPARPLDEKPMSGSYDFGDTRARVLEIELIAHSRYALEFLGTGRDAHILRSSKKRVIAQGTERPSAPIIDYIIPIYHWSNADDLFGRVRRTREAGWFRIWLNKDWYSSGNGELLAIVCWPEALLVPLARHLFLSRTRATPSHFATPPARIEPLVTRWGLDPLADETAAMGNMPASALKNRLRNLGQMLASADKGDATIEADVYHLQDIPSFEPKVSIDLTIKDAEVVLALYRPLCDKVTGRWYVDIQIDPQHAYCPFVRLGLARYQAHAEKNLRMSQIVATEFIQLLPERTITVVPNLNNDKRKREFDVIVSGATLTKVSTTGKSRSEILIRIENKHASYGGWFQLPMPSNVPAKDPWEGTKMEYFEKESVWRAKMSIDYLAGRIYSLVIEEYEHFHDGFDGETRKLVFFDRIALPGRT